jgi:hypothetical protein
MTGQYEEEYEKVWVLCTKCNHLVSGTIYHEGVGNVCYSCHVDEA